ncbi:MAG: hypothetical protein ACRDSZ_05725 [Pseudonocardiaceae bacterium]
MRRDSTNSSSPPSADSIVAKAKRRADRSVGARAKVTVRWRQMAIYQTQRPGRELR